MIFVRNNHSNYSTPIVLVFTLLFCLNSFGQTDTIYQDSITIDSNRTSTLVKGFQTDEIHSSRKVPPEAAGFVKRGERWMAQGPSKYEKALEQFAKAHKVSPDNSYVNFIVGKCYLLINRKKTKSINYLQKAYIENKRVDQKIHYYLGQAYHLNMDLDTAVAEYENYIEHYKKKHRRYSEAELDSALAYVYKKIEECKSGIELMKKAKKDFRL